MKRLLALAFVFIAFGAVAQSNKKDSELSIREIMEKYYSDKEFVLGASSRTGYLKDEKMMDIWLNEFSYNTPENDFKQSGVYSKPGAEWKSDNYRSYIEIARKNGQVIRAHGPISPQCSKWIMEDSRTGKEMEPVLKSYVKNLSKDLERNSDVVKWMDVVNETFCANNMKGTGYDGKESEDVVTYREQDWFGPRKGTNQWENPWPKMGFEEITYNGETFEIPRYIRMAFEIADKHAPSVKLIYNEHGKEINLDLWKKLRSVVAYLRSEGIRIDGIGWQSHVVMGWEKKQENKDNLIDMIEWCHANGLEFHITELDVQIPGTTDKINVEGLKASRAQQAETAGAVVEIMLQYIGKGAAGVNFWTMSDRHSAHGASFASMFNLDGTPHETYYKVKELLLKYAE